MLAYLLTRLCPANHGVEWLLPTNVAVLGNSADSITRAKINAEIYRRRKFDCTESTKNSVLAYVKYYCSGQLRWLNLCLCICIINVVCFNQYMHTLKPGVHLNLHQTSVPASQITQSVSIIKTNWLMLVRTITGITVTIRNK